MQIRVFLAAVLATLALALPVRAAATPEPLPEQVEAHIAVRSPLEFLGNIDNYVSAASKGTANAIPPGFISMMAQMYLPVPLDSWNSEDAAHVLILRSQENADPENIDFVVVFGVPDFTAFLESLEERDWLVGEPMDKGDFKDVRPIVVPTGKATVVADLGDGLAAFALDFDSIARGVKGWKPALISDADVTAHFSMGGDDSRLRDRIFSALNEEKDEIVQNIIEAGFKAETAKNLIVTVEKVLPLAVDELSGLRSMVMELGFDDDVLVFELGGKSTEGTWLGEIGQSLTGRDAVDLAVGKRLPAGAVSVGVSASPADLLPNAKNRMIRLASTVYGGMAPEFKDEIVDVTTRFMDSGPGQTAIGTYVDGIDQYRITLNMTDNPEKAMAAFNDGFELLNRIWASAIEDPDYGVRFAGALRNEGGVIFYRYQPVFVNEDKFQTLLDRIAGSRDGLDLDVAILKKLRIFVAELEDGIVSVAGELTDDTFLKLLAEVKSPAGDPLIASAPARDLVAEMPHAQVSVGIIEAGGIFQMYESQLTRSASDASPEELARAQDTLKQMQASSKTGMDLLGFSLGAEKGWLNSRVLVPAGVVSRIIRDIDKYERLQKRAAAVETPTQEPSPEPIPDEYEDDLEEEEEVVDEGDSSAA